MLNVLVAGLIGFAIILVIMSVYFTEKLEKAYVRNISNEENIRKWIMGINKEE